MQSVIKKIGIAKIKQKKAKLVTTIASCILKQTTFSFKLLSILTSKLKLILLPLLKSILFIILKPTLLVALASHILPAIY